MNQNKANHRLQDEEELQQVKKYKQKKHQFDEELFDEEDLDEDVLDFCKRHLK